MKMKLYKFIIWGQKYTETKETKPIFNKKQTNKIIGKLLEKENIPDFEVRYVDNNGWETTVYERITEKTHYMYKKNN